jgi:hypothetical protein
MPLPLSSVHRARFGQTITEAALIPTREAHFRGKVTGFHWGNVDDEEPQELKPLANWSTAAAVKLDRAVLYELVKLPGDGAGITDAQLRDRLLRELDNRKIIATLMAAAVTSVAAGTGPTPFMQTPVQTAVGSGCLKQSGVAIDAFDLMLILHMFGKKNRPRPIHPIHKPNQPNAGDPGDYFYVGANAAATEALIAEEVTRRVNELVAKINWEGNAKRGHEDRKFVWNRNGFYCGCG